jgi:nucleotide-binding universal stress UspA family protein
MSTQPVLVAIDLKEPSAYALDQGLALGKRTGAPVVVVHVIPDVVRVRALFPQLDSGDAIDAMDLESKIREAALGWLADRGVPADAVTLRIESGDAFVRILDLATSIDASVIVIGSTSRPEDAIIPLGSTAERVVRQADIPVLIARPSPDNGPIIAATDLSEASEPALIAGEAEAKARNVAFTALTVVDADTELQALSIIAPYSKRASEALLEGFDRLVAAADVKLTELLTRLGIQARRDVRTGVASTLIGRHARQTGASLVVIATRGSTGFTRVLVGSVAETVTRSSPCSVLVVRGTQE